MGVDTKAYISRDRFRMQDLKEIVERVLGLKVNVRKPDQLDDYCFLDFEFIGVTDEKVEQRQMYIGSGDKHGGFDCWTLSLGAWGSATEIMRKILAVTGGFLNENDCDDKCECIEAGVTGNLDFLVKQGLVEGYIKQGDPSKKQVAGLVKYQKDFNKKHKKG